MHGHLFILIRPTNPATHATIASKMIPPSQISGYSRHVTPRNTIAAALANVALPPIIVLYLKY